jgi:hypothetical protein
MLMIVNYCRGEGPTFGKHDVNADEDQRMGHDILEEAAHEREYRRRKDRTGAHTDQDTSSHKAKYGSQFK